MTVALKKDLEGAQLPRPPGVEGLDGFQLDLQRLVIGRQSCFRVLSVQVQEGAPIVRLARAAHEVGAQRVHGRIHVHRHLQPGDLQPGAWINASGCKLS